MDSLLIERLVSLVVCCVGGIFAVWGSRSSAKLSADAQIKSNVLTSYLAARFDAYKGVEEALAEWAIQRDPPSCAHVYRSVSVATLVASQETISSLNDVQCIVREFETTGKAPNQEFLSMKLIEMQCCMHSDLLTYHIPTILREPEQRVEYPG